MYAPGSQKKKSVQYYKKISVKETNYFALNLADFL